MEAGDNRTLARMHVVAWKAAGFRKSALDIDLLIGQRRKVRERKESSGLKNLVHGRTVYLNLEKSKKKNIL